MAWVVTNIFLQISIFWVVSTGNGNLGKTFLSLSKHFINRKDCEETTWWPRNGRFGPVKISEFWLKALNERTHACVTKHMYVGVVRERERECKKRKCTKQFLNEFVWCAKIFDRLCEKQFVTWRTASSQGRNVSRFEMKIPKFCRVFHFLWQTNYTVKLMEQSYDFLKNTSRQYFRRKLYYYICMDPNDV
jgi:hypothetical protein